MHPCDRIYQEHLPEARKEYLKAKTAGLEHPVIVLCPVDVYRLLRPEGPDPGADFLEALADETRGTGITLMVEDHAHIYEVLCLFSPDAAPLLGETPDPTRPFRIVVITRQGVKVDSEPEPRA